MKLLDGPHRALFLLAERLVPATQRQAWRREWQGEMAALAERVEGWPDQRRRLAHRALRVAWRDALWLRFHPEPLGPGRSNERPIHALHAPVGDGGGPLITLGRDVTFGLRRLRRSPAFALVVLSFLSLSIAAATVVFALVRSIVFEPLAYADADRLVRIVGFDTGEGQEDWMSMTEVDLLRDESRGFEEVGHSTTFPATWTREDGRRRIQRGFVSSEYFSLLGAPALHGRLLGPAEEDRTAAVLSHDFWRRDWQADPAAVGQSILVDDTTYTIVGVASPATYTHDFSTPPADVWLRFGPPRAGEDRDFRIFTALGRLDPAHDLESARAEVTTLEARLAAQQPAIYGGWQLRVEPLKETVVGGAGRPLVLLFVCLGLLLLGICANLANVVMARLLGRRGEVLLHLALGGDRSAIARQLAVEGALLSLLGGAAGLLLARWGLATLPGWLSFDLPRMEEISLGWQGPAFALAVTGLMTLLFAWLPARLGSRDALAQNLRTSRSTDARAAGLRSVMISAQVAVALPLLIVAGLLVGSLSDLRHADLGLRVDGLAGTRVSLPFRQVPEAAQREQYFADLIASLESRPDVSHAAATLQMPLVVHQADRTRLRIADREASPDDAPRALYQVVTPGYFDTLGTPLDEGRDFGTEDRADGAPVVIINRELQRRHFGELSPGELSPGEQTSGGLSPLGRQIDIELSIAGEPTLRTVVGVVGDIAQLGPAAPIEPMVFLPHSQVAWPSMTVVVRSQALQTPMEPILRQLREQSLAAEPSATLEPPVYPSGALRELLGPLRSASVLAAGFAVFAAALCLLGLYGLLSYDVQQSRRDCAIRRAVGASRSAIRFHFLGRAGTLVGAGTVAGLMVAWFAARMLAAAVDVVPAFDFGLFVIAALTLAAVAIAAGWIPAARAAKSSPAALLRSD